MGAAAPPLDEVPFFMGIAEDCLSSDPENGSSRTSKVSEGACAVGFCTRVESGGEPRLARPSIWPLPLGGEAPLGLLEVALDGASSSLLDTGSPIAAAIIWGRADLCLCPSVLNVDGGAESLTC